jgi:phospholipase C
MFLEKRFGVHVGSISPWHRAVSGDLTSAFDFTRPNATAPSPLPDMKGYAAVIAEQAARPLPTPPAVAQPLFQEAGVRLSRGLPYVLNATAVIKAPNISLTFTNAGAQGAVFHVYDKLHLNRIPRRYTVEAAKSLTDLWFTAADGSAYDLWVYGPAGFLRSFTGNADSWAADAFKPDIVTGYIPTTNHVLLTVQNVGSHANTLVVTPNNPLLGVAQTIAVSAGGTAQLALSLTATGNWYDFTASSANFERRFAGRMETGKDGISDPSMAMNL